MTTYTNALQTYRGRAVVFVLCAALSVVYQIERPYAWSIQVSCVSLNGRGSTVGMSQNIDKETHGRENRSPKCCTLQETLVVNRNREDVFTAAISEQWIAKVKISEMEELMGTTK